jgi:hypothetical protein
LPEEKHWEQRLVAALMQLLKSFVLLLLLLVVVHQSQRQLLLFLATAVASLYPYLTAELPLKLVQQQVLGLGNHRWLAESPLKLQEQEPGGLSQPQFPQKYRQVQLHHFPARQRCHLQQPEPYCARYLHRRQQQWNSRLQCPHLQEQGFNKG